MDEERTREQGVGWGYTCIPAAERGKEGRLSYLHTCESGNKHTERG